MVGVVFKGEVIVKDDSGVTDVSGGKQSGVVAGETEAVGGVDEGFGTDDEDV